MSRRGTGLPLEADALLWPSPERPDLAYMLFADPSLFLKTPVLSPAVSGIQGLKPTFRLLVAGHVSSALGKSLTFLGWRCPVRISHMLTHISYHALWEVQRAASPSAAARNKSVQPDVSSCHWDAYAEMFVYRYPFRVTWRLRWD